MLFNCSIRTYDINANHNFTNGKSTCINYVVTYCDACVWSFKEIGFIISINGCKIRCNLKQNC